MQHEVGSLHELVDKEAQSKRKEMATLEQKMQEKDAETLGCVRLQAQRRQNEQQHQKHSVTQKRGPVAWWTRR
eukprot:Skav205398  [mRNA]  locus=scaffold1642:243730:249778:+ [translate_table: standard]